MSDIVRVVGQEAVCHELDTYAPQARQNLERRAVRAGGNVLKRQMAFEGDTPGHPHSFTKVKVDVSASMRSGMVAHALVHPVSPLFNIFEPGAHGHTITPGRRGEAPLRGPQRLTRSGRPMTYRPATGPNGSGRPVLAGPAGSSSWDQTGRKRRGAFFSRGPVQHPGMDPRPVIPATMAAAGQPAAQAMAAVIFGNAARSAEGGS